jgi:2-dehydro-3-deoxyphosphogluconate aldolase/(4S)-4-hydroxy-2-oxoglutarate aldolase
MSRLENFTVGAGTVLNARQARDALAAGAQFLVSPGFDEGVWAVGQEANVPVIPGIATATEAQHALNAGARTVKFFPASTSGGIPALEALSAPFGQLRFMPTGGISLKDASQWLAVAAVVAVGGSWLTPPDLLAQGDFASITRIAELTTQSLEPGV